VFLVSGAAWEEYLRQSKVNEKKRGLNQKSISTNLGEEEKTAKSVVATGQIN